MGKKYLLIGLVGFLGSCVTQNEPSVTVKENNPQKIEIAENLTSTKAFVVPVVDGYITTVSCNGVQLARTSTPLTINVPKGAEARSDNNLDIKYSEGIAAAPSWNLWQTVMFEDSKNGDYDYNDLIIHTLTQMNGTSLKVDIHPIALGSTKKIKLGFVYSQGGEKKEEIVSDDCRKDLFGGADGFINTRKYNEHFDDFMKSIEVELPNSTDAVGINWFIEVDNGLRIYTVNQLEEKCIDDNMMPYGFVLTNIRENGIINDLSLNAANDAWESSKPDSSWSTMPGSAPSVPSSADNLAEALTPWALTGNEYYISTDFNSYPGFKQGTKLYITDGTRYTLNNTNVDYTIYVLPGATLSISKTVQNVKIYNYGTLEIVGNSLVVDANAAIYSNSNIDDDKATIKLSNSSLLSVQGDINVNGLEIGGTAKMFANSLTTRNLNLTVSGQLYVNGSLSCRDFELNSNGICYVDCRLVIDNNLKITNSGAIYVRSYFNAKKIEASSIPAIYLASGGLMEVSDAYFGNFRDTKVEIIGSQMGLFKVKHIEVNSLDGEYSLKGNIGFLADKITYGKDNHATLILGDNVTLDEANISISATSCNPGYNDVTINDNGVSWFSYPMELVDIRSCYDFDSWKNGNFNFTPLSGAKLFDIDDGSPIKGNKMKIYQLK